MLFSTGSSKISPNANIVLGKIAQIIKSRPELEVMVEGYTDNMFDNKSHKWKAIINAQLELITQKLNLSVPLRTKSARDSYATTLNRAGVSKDKIGEMLGHANSIVTEHYIASLDRETVFQVNKHLL